MLKITLKVENISKDEVKLIRDYYKYVINKFVSKKNQRNFIAVLSITEPKLIKNKKERKELKEFSAWLTYEGNINGKKTFNISMDANCINKNAKKTITRMKNFLKYFGHELIHLKQYLNGELKNYVDGSFKYLGQFYSPISNEADETYWDSPEEIEAYGRQEGLYQMFLKQYKKD